MSLEDVDIKFRIDTPQHVEDIVEELFKNEKIILKREGNAFPFSVYTRFDSENENIILTLFEPREEIFTLELNFPPKEYSIQTTNNSPLPESCWEGELDYGGIDIKHKKDPKYNLTLLRG